MFYKEDLDLCSNFKIADELRGLLLIEMAKFQDTQSCLDYDLARFIITFSFKVELFLSWQ